LQDYFRGAKSHKSVSVDIRAGEVVIRGDKQYVDDAVSAVKKQIEKLVRLLKFDLIHLTLHSHP
jgi:hypothetical protein